MHRVEDVATLTKRYSTYWEVKMELTGKNVFITGSLVGLAKTVALAFAKKGANIVLNGRVDPQNNDRK